MEKKALKKWTSKQYTEASNTLKKLGYNITYKGNDRKTFNQRGIIRRLYERKKAFIFHADFNNRSKDRSIANEEFDFAFVRLSEKTRKFAKKHKLFSKEQITPKGVFIEKPANIPRKNIKFRITKGGVGIDFRGLPVSEDTELLRRFVVKLDTELLSIDPQRAVDEAIGRRQFDSLFLLINGFRAKSGKFYQDSESFNDYITNSLIPSFNKRNAASYPQESQQQTAEKFADIFHMELIK